MDNHLNRLEIESNLYMEISEFYKTNNNDLSEADSININIDDNLDLDKFIDTIGSNEIDRIFSEIKSSIIN
ncbi:hypothetical protein OAQ99_01675 [Candidatus Kapabacteria bacterium]|nr:hypothetical protein [Candidatus Kapabacteria bacterium]